MSRVTLSIYGFRQRFDEQFEELLGRQGWNVFLNMRSIFVRSSSKKRLAS